MEKVSRRASWLASVALLLLLLPHALASAADAAPCGPLVVGLREYPRLYQRDAKGEYHGLDKEFFEALAQRSGCSFEYKLDSQPRLWEGLRSGRIGLASWVIQTEDRAAVVNVIPILQIRPMAITWRDSPAATQAEFAADARLTAIKVRQSAYGPGYDELFAKLQQQGRLSEVADFDTALKVFSARRVNLIVAYPWTVFGQSEQWMKEVRFSDWHPGASAVRSGLAISRRSVGAADAKRLEEAVQSMQRDGSLAQMAYRYMPMDLVKLVQQSSPQPR
jgi:polar amino acid transport system substrate-binding protein